MKCNEAFTHIVTCDECWQAMQEYIIRLAAGRAGGHTSEKKAKSSAENGKLGGRPPIERKRN